MAESAWRLLVRDVHAELVTILGLEGKAAPELIFGRRPWTDFDNAAPRCVWIQAGGRFTQTANPLVAPAAEGDPPPPLLGVRLAMSEVRIWHTSDEAVERVLDRLWMATDHVAAERFLWTDASYGYPSEEVGQKLKNGISVIVLHLPTMVPVLAEYEGEIETVEVASTEIRTGFEIPTGEVIADTAYETNEWVDPDVFSES